MAPPAPRAAALLATLALAGAASAGCAERGFRLALVEENDLFNLADGLDVDRDYTQGSLAAVTLAAADTPGWARDAARATPLFAREAPVHLGLLLGQEIYTPANVHLANPPPGERPYAGWLHAGIALQSPALDADPVRRRDRLDHLQLDLGVVGPAALGEWAQNTAHRTFGIPEARGWDGQLGNEPGILLTREIRWRVLSGDFGGSGWRWDLLPRAQVRAGNVRVDGTAGATARIGWETPRDFGPMAVDARGLEAGPGTRPWACLYAGTEARGVARDLFFEGSTFRDSVSVTPARLVRTGTLGLAWGIGPFSATYAQVWSSPDFRERRRFHRTTTLMVAWTWAF